MTGETEEKTGERGGDRAWYTHGTCRETAPPHLAVEEAGEELLGLGAQARG